MKKAIFTLFGAALSLSSQAQLQLSYNNAAGQQAGTVVIKTDMTSNVDINLGGLPNFAPANNMHWDMSNVGYGSAVSSITYDTSTSPFFIPAEYSSEITYSNTGALPYVTNLKFEIRSTGMFAYGEHLDRQAFPLGFITGNMNDSLVILNQDIDYSANITNMPYPTAPGITFWNNNFSYNTNLELTYNAQGYNQSPITKVSHITTVDSAIGWGTISGKRLDNAQGDEIDVVQVKNITTITDSFYSGSVPVPPNVLSTFGLSQGMVTNVWQYNWYRAGEVTAMLNVVYDEATFTNIHDINFHRERMPFHTGVKSVLKNDNVILYPNPAANQVSLSLGDKSIKQCNYELVGVTGQVVAEGNTNVTSGNMAVGLENVPSGMYYIRLTSNGQLLVQKPVAVIK